MTNEAIDEYAPKNTKGQSPYVKVRGKISEFDTVVGRKVFGADNNFTRYIASSLVNTKFRIKSNYKAPEGPRLFDAKDLHTKGYMIFEDLYDQDLIKTIQTKVSNAYDAGRWDGIENDKKQTLNQLQTDVPEIGQLITEPLMNALCDYYKCYANIANVTCYRNHSPDENSRPGIFSSNWHTDRLMPTLIKLFYLVHDTDDTHGPLHMIAQDTTQGIMRHEFKNRFEPGSAAQNAKNHVKLTGKAGTLGILNTATCLHKAGLPANGKHRDIFSFQILPSVKPFSPDWVQDPHKFRHYLRKQGRWWVFEE